MIHVTAREVRLFDKDGQCVGRIKYRESDADFWTQLQTQIELRLTEAHSTGLATGRRAIKERIHSRLSAMINGIDSL